MLDSGRKVTPPDHWQDDPQQKNYYGFNFTPMSYPVVDEGMLFKLASVVDLQDALVPDSGSTCSHGNLFSDGDEDLTLRHKEVIIYDDC